MRQSFYTRQTSERVVSPPRGHHTKYGFVNPHCGNTRRTLLDAILWGCGYFKDPVPIQPVPDGFEYPNRKDAVNLREPTLCWINHTTCMIQVDGITLLTDPVWGDRVSPVNFCGPRRQHAPPISLEELPPIDYVLLSHDHYDHLDKPTILKIAQRNPDCTYFIPLGVQAWFRKYRISNIVEMDWWDSIAFPAGRHQGPEIQVYSVPAQHFSGRTALNQNTTLWCGWVVRFIRANGAVKQLYFVGDTGYNAYDFLRIGETFGGFDLSLIPIGAYSPREFMSPVHVHPEESVAIHLDANSRLSVATHWKTFRLSGEPVNQPPYDLYRAMEAVEEPVEKFRVLEPGQEINW